MYHNKEVNEDLYKIIGKIYGINTSISLDELEEKLIMPLEYFRILK